VANVSLGMSSRAKPRDLLFADAVPGTPLIRAVPTRFSLVTFLV
jgi:hypothetical protein